MTDINLGVIGLGRMGQIFSRHLARYGEGARLAAVSSRNPAVANKIARQGRDVTIYSDYRDLLANPAIDAVVIATLTHTHHEIVVAAAEAGKAIFCEKPIALTLAETDAIMAAVQKAGVPFQVAFMRRFDKGYAAAKRQIEAGAIGQPVVINAISRDPGCPDKDWADPASSGGMILDLAIHDFDAIRWLMNDEVDRVYAEGSVLTCPDLAEVNDIDSAIVSLRFSQGGLGSVDACRNARYGYDIRCEIRGAEGTLQVGYLQDTPVLTLNQAGVSHDVVPWFEERFTPAYGAQLDHFIESLQKDVTPSVGLEDARISLQIALAATQSHREERPIFVKDAIDL
ncbi:MAG: Gfo/Idh/MocA family oxidoreductase [Chloroflexota bacterium]